MGTALSAWSEWFELIRSFTMPTLVMKFGGTSVGKGMDKCVEIVQQTLADTRWSGIVVVTSALTQVTNKLLRGAENAAAHGDLEAAQQAVEEIEAQHRALAAKLLIDEATTQGIMKQVCDHLEYYSQLCQAMGVIREFSPRGMDAVASLGERMALPLLCGALEQAGVPTDAVDASQVIVTDANFQDARPLMDLSRDKANNRLLPSIEQGKVAVVTGFVAATESGTTTTLGRGGSDYSAALLAALLDAAEVWIWTDVTGIMSADPRVASDAKTIPRLSLREVAELAYFGAKVLHPKTIRPVVEKNIPLRICNTFDPEAEGTYVQGDGTGCRRARSFETLPGLDELELSETYPIKAVTAMKDMALIQLSGRGMIGVAGLSARLFGAVTSTNTSVSLITQASSEQSICVAVAMDKCEQVVEAIKVAFKKEMEMNDIDGITFKQPVAIITVVGAEMCNQVGVAGKVFSAIGQAEVNVMAIAQGSSEVS